MSLELVRFMRWEKAAEPAQRLFAQEEQRIRRRLPGALVEHIGATSVPGLITKGDLDIAVRVAAGGFEAADRALAEMYPRNRGNERTGTYSSFADDAVTPPLGVQVCVIGGPEDFFVSLRDLLCTRPDLVGRLNELKRSFDNRPMADYRAAKSVFIESILRGKC